MPPTFTPTPPQHLRFTRTHVERFESAKLRLLEAADATALATAERTGQPPAMAPGLLSPALGFLQRALAHPASTGDAARALKR